MVIAYGTYDPNLTTIGDLRDTVYYNR